MKVLQIVALFVFAALVSCEPPAPQNRYLPPQQQQQPSNNYLPPQSSYSAPSNSYSAPAQQPSSNYGAPAITSAIFPSRPSSAYGAPSQQGGGGGNSGYSYGGNNDESYGPAKYNFEYNVQDYQSGNDFGHMESRDGDRTTGRYYVLLPDGRKQIVNYEADENGYRPTISYEQTNSGGGGGYNANAQSGFGGYDSNAQSKFNGY